MVFDLNSSCSPQRKRQPACVAAGHCVRKAVLEGSESSDEGFGLHCNSQKATGDFGFLSINDIDLIARGLYIHLGNEIVVASSLFSLGADGAAVSRGW